MNGGNTIVIHGETLIVAAGLAIFFALLAWHIGVHSWRERQQRECMQQVSRLWSFVVSITQRYIHLAERFTKEFPKHGPEVNEEVESLIKLLRALQQNASANITVDAQGNISIVGDLTGRDKFIQEK